MHIPCTRDTILTQSSACVLPETTFLAQKMGYVEKLVNPTAHMCSRINISSRLGSARSMKPTIVRPNPKKKNSLPDRA